MTKQWHEQNRKSWNEATKAHNSHKRDQARFLRDGGSTLFPEEIALLGDVEGKSVVHLQCNAGQDTLSLVHLGAKPTGVDISDEAIDFARRLSEESGLSSEFHREDLFTWLAQCDEASFDVAFSSYGALPWLSDLNAWAQGIHRILKPGGAFVLMEFHPMAWCVDDSLHLQKSPTAAGAPLTWDEGVVDYVAESSDGLTPSGFEEGVRDFDNPEKCHEFLWSVGDVLGAILGSGLVLEIYREYPFANGCRVHALLEPDDQKRFRFTDGQYPLPLMMGLRAVRP